MIPALQQAQEPKAIEPVEMPTFLKSLNFKPLNPRICSKKSFVFVSS